MITIDRHLPVVVTGTSDNRAASEELLHGLKRNPVKNLVGATNLQEMLGLLVGARFVLTSDSGNLHMAHLVGTPSLTVFGPTAPEEIFADGFWEWIVPVRLGLPCSPCEFSPRRYRCPGPPLQCMNGLEGTDVKDKLLRACHSD